MDLVNWLNFPTDLESLEDLKQGGNILATCEDKEATANLFWCGDQQDWLIETFTGWVSKYPYEIKFYIKL